MPIKAEKIEAKIIVEESVVESAPVVEEPKQEIAMSSGFMALIEKASLIPGNVETLERMMKMQIEWEDRQEERAFSDAVARIVAKLSHIRIIKNKSVGYDKVKGDPTKGQVEAFKYTTIEEIEKIVRPLLINESITPSYTCKASGVNGMYDVTCRLTRSRQFRESSIPLPMDTSGGKNNTQGMGSTFKYGQRYALCAALFITTVGEDNDGQGAPITEEQAAEIKLGLKETGLDVKKFLSNLKTEAVELIPTKDYGRAMTAIDAQRYRLSKKEKSINKE